MGNREVLLNTKLSWKGLFFIKKNKTLTGQNPEESRVTIVLKKSGFMTFRRMNDR